MRLRATGLMLGVAIATVAVLAGQAPPAGSGQAATAAEKQAKTVAKLAEPWPDAATVRKRRVEAEGLALFQADDPLPVTIRADFKAINKDRDPQSTKRFPGTITVAGVKGTEVSIPVQLGTRGNLRLRSAVCGFAPLKIDFPKTGLQGTPFAGQDSLKLATHCQSDTAYEQYVLREYATYRLFNLLTARSFRARLARATYIDEATGKNVASRYGFFLEADVDVARRMEGRLAQITGQRFLGLDNDGLLFMTLFQWMIGNTDFSIVSRHNVSIVQLESGIRYPITYDFDSAGLVDTPYAAPDKRLELSSTRQRLFRGPCRTMDQFDKALVPFREKRTAMMAVFDSLPDLTDRTRRDAKAYLDEFYSIINNPDRVKRILLGECLKGGGM